MGPRYHTLRKLLPRVLGVICAVVILKRYIQVEMVYSENPREEQQMASTRTPKEERHNTLVDIVRSANPRAEQHPDPTKTPRQEQTDTRAAMPTEHALCQRSRLERYHQQCANLHHTPPSGAGTGKFTHINSHNDLEALSVNDLKTVVRNIVVDDRHSVLYCAIPKAGCTTWKHYLLQNLPREYDPDEAANQIHNETLAAERGLPFLSKFNQTEIFQRLDTHRKFMVVRHPLDRLVSTYLEKFAGHKRWYKEHTAVKIIKEMRLNPSEHALKYGDDLTFDEFIRFVVKSHHTEPLLDYHWENFAKLCFPCAISYDYIAKLETNTPDAEYIVDKYLEGVHYDKVAVKNQNRNVTHGIWGTGKPLDLYANITDSVYEELVPFYKGDMEMFGYSAERNSKTVIKCSGGESCC